MIGRILVLAATALTAVVGVGLAGWLEWDRSQATPVYVPVTLGMTDDDRITVRPSGPFSRFVLELDRDETPHLHLGLDDRAVVTTVTQHDAPPAAGTPFVRVRSGNRILPAATRLNKADHDRVAYALYRITASGDAYLISLADEDLGLLGRGDRAW